MSDYNPAFTTIDCHQCADSMELKQMRDIKLDRNAVLMVISVAADNLGYQEENRAFNVANIIDGFEERMDPELNHAEIMELFRVVSGYLADLNSTD